MTSAVRRRSLPPGVFSVTLATCLMTASLVVGWHIAAGAVIALPVLLDRRPAEWQMFAASSGLLAVCAAVTQAQELVNTSLVYLAGCALCGLAAAGFFPRAGRGAELAARLEQAVPAARRCTSVAEAMEALAEAAPGEIVVVTLSDGRSKERDQRTETA